MSGGPLSEAPRRLPDRALSVAVVLACLAALVWAQFTVDHLHDGDSYFHVRAAEQLAAHGVQKEFPQTQFSTWKEEYSDKDFLFHVALIPFVAGGRDLVRGGKLAVAVFDGLLLLTLLAVMWGLGIRFAGLWILLLLSSDRGFLLYLMSVRPHLLSNALIVLETFLLLRGRTKTLFFVAAAHVLAHSSFVLLPVMAAAPCVAALLLRRGPAPVKPLLAVAAGIVTASLLHPFFPNNLSVAFDQIVQVARNVWGIGGEIPPDLFGAELMPLPLATLARSFAGWLPALLGLGAFWLGAGRERRSQRVLTLALMSAGFGLLSLPSARFYPLFLSLATVLAGSAWTRLAGGRTLAALWSAGGRPRIAIVLIAACLVVAAWNTNVVGVRNDLRTQTNEISYGRAAAFIDAHAVPDDVIYHNFWQAFAGLYFYRPNGRYIVALDPVFLFRYDRERFHSMLRAYRGTADDVHAVIAGEFGARWVFVAKFPENAPFGRLLRAHPKIRLRHHDPYTEVYEVLDG